VDGGYHLFQEPLAHLLSLVENWINFIDVTDLGRLLQGPPGNLRNPNALSNYYSSLMRVNPDRLRVAIERIFEPPVDLLLDPSLMTTARSFEQLLQSQLFESQRQATLGASPIQVQVGNVHVPATFGKSLSESTGNTAREASVWEFFRGNARGSDQEAIKQFIDEYQIVMFESPDTPDGERWHQRLQQAVGGGMLAEVTTEIFYFLKSGGVLLARTSKSIEAIRDIGTTTVDIGAAQLRSHVNENLEQIGYPATAAKCAFGVPDMQEITSRLNGELLPESPETILYSIGG
jgi:hypothetical protein